MSAFIRSSRRSANYPLIYRILDFFRRKKGLLLFSFTKRQKFAVSVLILSLWLFFSEHFLGRSGIFMLILLSVLTLILFLWCVYTDLKENFTFRIFILPFLYSLSFGLFYFLVPARFMTRILITFLYAVGLYSLFLSHNIFTVSSIRTIALVSSARIVSFVITLISYFFLSTIVLSLHAPLLLTPFIVFGYSFLLTTHSLWTYALDKPFRVHLLWAALLSLGLFETTLILLFWPSRPTVTALFLTGLFYTIVSLSHVWIDRRLFRSVMWEYIWVTSAMLFVLIFFTSWR